MFLLGMTGTNNERQEIAYFDEISVPEIQRLATYYHAIHQSVFIQG